MKAARGFGQPAVARSLYIGGIVFASVLVVVLQVRWMNQKRSKLGATPIHQFSRIIDLQTQRVYCENCEGSGFVRDPEQSDAVKICPVCIGLGFHPVRHLRATDALCPQCRGLGRTVGAVYDEADFCSRCDGRGLIRYNHERFRIQAQKVVCDHCSGRGILRNPDDPGQLDMCGLCYGLGHRLVRRLDGRDDYCTGCKGIGRLHDKETGEARWCTLCGGRGLMVKDASVDPAEEHPEAE